MYTKTLIAFVILLCLVAVYLVFNCNCEKFQNNNADATDNADAANEEPEAANEEPEAANEEPEATEATEATEAGKEMEFVPEDNVKATTTVIPVSLDTKYKVNLFNTQEVKVPELDNMNFNDFSKDDAKVDIIGIDTGNLTFSVLVKPTLKEDEDEKTQENKKQVIASSENWYIELKSKQVK